MEVSWKKKKLQQRTAVEKEEQCVNLLVNRKRISFFIYEKNIFAACPINVSIAVFPVASISTNDFMQYLELEPLED